MEKLLTVSVAAYNGAATLQKALSSCLVADESLQALLDVIIIDDMISSGDSMLDVAKQLKKRKANRVFVASTFGLFTNGLERFDEAYEQGLIYRVMTTNSIYQTPELLEKEWYINVDISKFTALFIDRLNHDASISDILNPIDKITKKINEYNNK